MKQQNNNQETIWKGKSIPERILEMVDLKSGMKRYEITSQLAVEYLFADNKDFYQELDYLVSIGQLISINYRTPESGLEKAFYLPAESKVEINKCKILK